MIYRKTNLLKMSKVNLDLKKRYIKSGSKRGPSCSNRNKLKNSKSLRPKMRLLQSSTHQPSRNMKDST